MVDLLNKIKESGKCVILVGIILMCILEMICCDYF